MMVNYAFETRIMRHEGYKYNSVSLKDSVMIISTFILSFYSSFLREKSNFLTFPFLGPYSLNGVPLRRINQKYVIATSAKVSLNGVDVSSIDDALFARKKDEAEGIDPVRAAAQAAVDAALSANIKETEMLSAYLQAKFTLGRHDRPHLLKF